MTINDDDLSDALAKALKDGAAVAMSDTLRDALHQHLFMTLRPLLAKAAPTPILSKVIHDLLANPHSRTSTAALALIGVIRKELLEAAGRETDPSEQIRLRNLAACLPVMGA